MNHSLLLLTAALLLGGSAEAQNISGRITCKGKGLKGVAVSDGYNIVVTDSTGRYEMNSGKQLGLVYYSIPGGYQPEMKDGFRPQFWASLRSADSLVNEVHDFALRRVKNQRFRMAIGTDSHLANRAGDIQQFNDMFVASLRRETKKAKKVPVYSMLLGDITWDRYWVKNNYDLNAFLQTCREAKYPVPLWTVMGNHDNDPSVPYTTELETDLRAEGKWRGIMGPNYYSFNLGKVHFVVLDDISYTNKPKANGKYDPGVVGKRDYRPYLNYRQMSWLKRDLELIADSTTPIIIATHAPILTDNRVVPARPGFNLSTSSSELMLELLRRFPKVHIVSGHKHTNTSNISPYYPNVQEHNINALCGIMWDSFNSSGKHNCMDGTPGGYYLWNVDGDSLHWEFKTMDGKECNQFRIYDMNTVRKFYADNPTLRAMLKKYPDRTDFAQYADNIVLVNVYALAPGWKVEVLEDGQLLKSRRIYEEDPYHVLCHDIIAFKEKGSIIPDRAGKKNMHMIRCKTTSAHKPVTVRVTDSFGRVYERTIQRPHPYSLEMEALEK